MCVCEPSLAVTLKKSKFLVTFQGSFTDFKSKCSQIHLKQLQYELFLAGQSII